MMERSGPPCIPHQESPQLVGFFYFCLSQHSNAQSVMKRLRLYDNKVERCHNLEHLESLASLVIPTATFAQIQEIIRNGFV